MQKARIYKDNDLCSKKRPSEVFQGLEEQKLEFRDAWSNCADSLAGRNGYGEVGGPILGRGNSIGKGAELRSLLLCVEGTLPSA